MNKDNPYLSCRVKEMAEVGDIYETEDPKEAPQLSRRLWLNAAIVSVAFTPSVAWACVADAGGAGGAGLTGLDSEATQAVTVIRAGC